ncbi:hypothetical protein HOI18_05510 [Candidatus Uhrbacteria bacterium]|nr:hypothetical protein [Candidatus Uhrbacteria bacterium]
MNSTMNQSETDRWYQQMRVLRGLLPRMEEDEARDAKRLLRESQNAFAAETPVAWVAMVCEDYACPNTGRPYQRLLPISRYRHVTTTTGSYGFGDMCFGVIKRGRRVQGIRFRAQYDYDGLSFEEPVDVVLKPDDEYPSNISGYNVYFCIFVTREAAVSWLSQERGISFEDSVGISIDRLHSKL